MRRASKALILLIAIVGSSVVYAADGDSVNLTVGRSTVVDTGTTIARVSLTSADVADALVTSSNELLINGKTPGTISMFVWDRAGAIRKYEINVQRDLARLTDQYKELFPGEKITAHSSGKSIVLSGEVTSQGVVDKAMNVAAGYVEKKDEVVSLLQILPSGASNQVLLRVRFAEVSRNAMTQLGATWYSDGYKNTIGSITTGQFPTPFFDQNKAMVNEHQVFSDYLNLFLFDFKHDLGGVIKALQGRGLFQSLAEPNLVAQDGKEASFLAGGEFPIPVAQASGSNIAISIQFKEFGIRLNFTPKIVGDRIQLHVRPEVSTLDFNNAILLQGFRIPALSSRRAETDVELQNGQTFAIAGLLNNTVASSLQKIPGIGDIPILGNLFKSKSANKEQTELVVMITPEILARNSNGVTSTLPRGSEQYLAPLPQNRQVEPPPPAFRRSGAVAQPPAARPAASNSDPAAAAAVVSALTPGSVPVVAAAGPSAASTSTPAPASRPMTRQEQATVERARRQEKQQKEQAAKQAAVNQRKAEEEAKRQAAFDKRQAEANKATQEAAEKRAAETALRQAELNKKHQQAVEEAAAKMKAAQAAYEAELAKTKKQ
jgi:pilus assembly protein CpaC